MALGQKTKATPTMAAVAALVAGVLPLWAIGLVGLVAKYAAHNYRVALAFVAAPDTFASLTEAQQCLAFDSAMSVHGVGIKMPRIPVGRSQRATWDDGTFTTGMAAIVGRSPVAFNWVHQRFNPLAEPGQKRLPPLFSAYAQLRAVGHFGDVATVPEYVDAVQALCEKQAKVATSDYDAHRAACGITGEPVLVQRPVKNGYGIATVEALKNAPDRVKNTGAGTKDVEDLKALLAS